MGGRGPLLFSPFLAWPGNQLGSNTSQLASALPACVRLAVAREPLQDTQQRRTCAWCAPGAWEARLRSTPAVPGRARTDHGDRVDADEASTVQANVQAVRERVEKVSCATPSPSPTGAAARQGGLRRGPGDFGENYMQELAEKAEAAKDVEGLRHFIGSLQSNKVRQLCQVPQLVCATRSSARRSPPQIGSGRARPRGAAGASPGQHVGEETGADAGRGAGTCTSTRSPI